MYIIEYEMKHWKEKNWTKMCGKFRDSEHFVQFEIREKQNGREIRKPEVVKVIKDKE